MKKFFGLFILVLVLASVSGCTQSTKTSATATTVPTTISATEVPTTIVTTEQTTTIIPVTPEVTVMTTTATETTAVTTVATPTPASTPSTKITTIHIRNNSFVPAVLTVLPGTGITWVNDDSVSHIVKASGKSAGKFTSATMVSGARFGYTFGETQGTYEYMDPGFAGMNGTIIVANGAAVVGAPTVQPVSP